MMDTKNGKSNFFGDNMEEEIKEKATASLLEAKQVRENMAERCKTSRMVLLFDDQGMASDCDVMFMSRVKTFLEQVITETVKKLEAEGSKK